MQYNLILFQLELVVFLISLSYIVYYFFFKTFWFFSSIKKIAWFWIKKNENPISKIDISEEKIVTNFTSKVVEVSLEDQNKIIELLKKIKTNISKLEYDLAKNQIVEWLALDKFNIDLNLELAIIYIEEKDYVKAEYIYKDLLLVHSDNFDILKKLAYTLTMQEKYDLAIEIYKKAYDLKEDDIETVNMLAQLYYYKWLYVDSITFLKVFLKYQPRDIENLVLLAWAYKNIWKILDSVNTYNRVLELDPYNEEVKKEIKELEELEYIPKETV